MPRLRHATLLVILVAGADARADTGGAWLDEPFLAADPHELVRRVAALPPPRPPAGARVIADEVQLTVDAGGRFAERRRVVAQVLGDGVAPFEELRAEFTPWCEERPTLRARVVLPDGSARTLDAGTVEEAPAGRGAGKIYSDLRVVRAPLPSVSAGAILELEITVRQTRPAFDGGSLMRIPLGRSVRVLRERLVVQAPSATPVHVALRGLPQVAPQRRSAGGTVTDVYELGGLAPFPADAEARGPLVDVATGRSWREVAARYAAIVDDRIARSNLAATAREIVAGATGRDAIAQRVLDWLPRKVRYTGVEMGAAALEPRSPDETLARAYGDCKDLATLVVALLRAAGLDAHLALLTVGGMDVDASTPGLGAFDHAIVRVEGAPAPLWLDATDPSQPVGELPRLDADRQALVIDARSTGFVTTPPSRPREDRIRVDCELRYRATGHVSIRIAIEAGGDIEQLLRRYLLVVGEEAMPKLLAQFGPTMAGARAKVTDVQHSDPRDPRTPLRITVGAEAGDGHTLMAEGRFGVPVPAFLLLGQLPKSLTEGGSATSDTPLAFSSRTEWYVRLRVVPPRGFVVLDVPTSGKTALGPATLERNHSVDAEGVVTATARLTNAALEWTPADVTAARRAIAEITRLPPAIAFEAKARTAVDQGRVEEAVAAARQLVADAPSESYYRAMHAASLAGIGLLDAAREEARRAVALAPGDAVAHGTLGWLLLQDAFGAWHLTGPDAVVGERELREGLRIDPQNIRALEDLAVVLSRGHGVSWGPGTRVDELVGLRRRIVDLDESDDHRDLLAWALAWPGRWPEVAAVASQISNAEWRTRLLVAAAMMQHGSDAALAVAATETPDAAKRQRAIVQAVEALAWAREYRAAEKLLDALAKTASLSLDEQRALTRVKALRRWETLPPAASPRDAFVRRVLAGFVRVLDDQAHLALLSSTSRALAAESPEELPRLVLRASYFDGSHTPDGELDSLLTRMVIDLQGDDQTGWRMRIDDPEWKITRYFIREGKGYALVGGPKSPSAVGAEILRRVERGDLAGARKWWGWAVADHVASLGTTYEYEAPKTAEALRLAAARLLYEGHAYERAHAAVAAGCATGPTGTLCRELRAESAARTGRSDEALVEYAAIPTAALVCVHCRERALILRSLGRCGDLAASVERWMKETPKYLHDLDLEQAWVAECRGDTAREESLMRPHAKLPDVVSSAELVWLLVGRTPAPAEALTLAQRTVAGTAVANEAILDALAIAHAELGHLADARKTIASAMAADAREQPSPTEHYILGRIAEKYGEPEAARGLYQQALASPLLVPPVRGLCAARMKVLSTGK